MLALIDATVCSVALSSSVNGDAAWAEHYTISSHRIAAGGAERARQRITGATLDLPTGMARSAGGNYTGDTAIRKTPVTVV